MTSSHTLQTKDKKLKAISLIFIAGLVIFVSTKMLLSSLYGLQTTLFLEDWQNKAKISDQIAFKPIDQAWSNANQASQKAINMSPVNNAFLQESAGKIYQWKTYDQPFGNQASQSNRVQALEAFRKQTKITPKWPKAWLNLLAVKIELNEYDKEFYNAFNMAKITANQNPEVSTQFTLLSIQAWSNVNNSAKNQVLKNIINEAGLGKKQSQDLKPLLQAYNLLEVSCIYARAIKENTYELCK
ncbi:hypothetical protein [Thiomicrorhabdus sp. Milos-T2]|uniref:hypothetical protein n=1 Tax=Thiomicrorhabdus sp. Milos-T2 TaxID=90814 RepID=UPI000493EB98|nr:hypothetical protein [Thiomicrorhabdus sp. Milos-T2]